MVEVKDNNARHFKIKLDKEEVLNLDGKNIDTM